MKRSEAREQAFVLLFEQSICHDMIREMIDTAEMSDEVRVDAFAERLAEGAEQNLAAIDALIEKNTHGWRIARLPKVTLAILRLAIYEVLFEKEIPVSVSINEAVDLAKKYGGAEDAPFVNGVLGSVAKETGEKNA